MDFIKRMKKREFIEMGLKALASLLLAFIAIILMECMIYGINFKAYKDKGTSTMLYSSDTIAYCVEDGKNNAGETVYFVLNYNEDQKREWTADPKNKLTKDQIIAKYIDEYDAKVVWRAPNAFEFTITPVHYVVMGVFIAGIAAFFTYKVIKLDKSYKEVEENYKKTGTIEISNR